MAYVFWNEADARCGGLTWDILGSFWGFWQEIFFAATSQSRTRRTRRTANAKGAKDPKVHRGFGRDGSFCGRKEKF